MNNSNERYYCKACTAHFYNKEEYYNHVETKEHRIHFNKEQNELITAILKMLKSEIKSIRCNSPGGTGKSYVLTNNTCGYDVLYIAPSNAACHVLRKNGAKIVKTYAQAFGWSQDYDEKGNAESVYDALKFTNFSKYRIVVIDEISMLNSMCYSLFYEFIHLKGIPYILLGDYCQLPPIEVGKSRVVNHELSQVFEKDENISLFFNHDVEEDIVLIENKRLTDPENPLRLNIEKIRDDISTETKCVLEHNFTITKASILRFKDKEAIFLAYTNAVVKKLNNFIRRIYFPETYHEEWNIYERIIMNSSYKAEIINPEANKEGKIFKFMFLNTSEIYNISSITEIEKTIEGTKFNVYKMVLDQKYIIYKLMKKDFDTLKKFKKDKKDEILALKDKQKQREEFRKLNMQTLPQIDCSIGYCYAVTVHKAQGSSFQNTIVAVEDFTDKDVTKNNKLLYTAVSRTRENCYLANNPTNKKYRDERALVIKGYRD